jgi:carbamoylphosphate synthase large subunit
MECRILIFQMLRWPNGPRLAIAFGAAGARVYALCRKATPIDAVSTITRRYPLNPFLPRRSLLAAIDDCTPDLIVPCDDPAVQELHRLHASLDARQAADRRLMAIIERSLGEPRSFDIVTRRSELRRIADSAGTAIPKMQVIGGKRQLDAWLAVEGFPSVLKLDYTCGGTGVAIAEARADIRPALSRLTGLQLYLRALRRAALDRDPNLLLHLCRGERPLVSVQKFIGGKLANCAVACWQGRSLAGIAVEVVQTRGHRGQSTVVRIIENHEMLDVAGRIIASLGLSGFCGFDFVIDEDTGRPVLIEINPRATQVNHLRLSVARDLPGALVAAATGAPVPPVAAVTDRDLVALFPQEWRRDPTSPYLDTAYHDIPLEEPRLVAAYAYPGKDERRAAGDLSLNRA